MMNSMNDRYIETEINADDSGHIASVFALGNGYLGMRGTYDEDDEKLPDESGMYINGIFETAEPYKYYCLCRGLAKCDQYTVNLPDWRIIEVYIDGEKACISNGLKNHKRVLDFKKGCIERTFDFTSKTGKTIKVKSTRIVNMERVHSAQIRYEVTPTDFSGEIEIKAAIVKNTWIYGTYPTYTESEIADKNGIVLVSKTKNTGMRAACAVLHKADNAQCEVVTTDERYERVYKVCAEQGKTFTLEKYASFYSDVDNVDNMAEEARAEAANICQIGFDNLQAEQEKFWEDYWKIGDVEIEGNDEDQMAVRFSLFHLRQQLATVNDMSIGATGLTGQNYSGKVFWDTEMYLMPYYIFTDPQTCKGLLMYRYRILDKARERAEQLGGVGALYSWCSIDGEETSVVYEASTAEYHINSDIAYAIWRYYDLTGDRDFVYNYGAEILFETAKYMAHRGCFVDGYSGRFCINAVCGPDEYACGVNNNCYTNLMVRFHLNYALRIYNEMLENDKAKLDEVIAKTGIDKEELALWKKAADNMYYRVNKELGIYEQDDCFVYNDPVDMDTLPRHSDIRTMFHPLDLWRMQVLKQADVVLLTFVLGDLFTKEEKKRNYDYYEPKTNHGSSLSTAIHSIIANEIGYYDQAYEYFRNSAFMDIYDVKKNTSGGLHIACLGGVWMCVVNGFLGMRHYDKGIEFNVHLPKAWTSCKCHINYKDSVIEICAGQKETVFSLVSGDGFSFNANGKEYSIDKDNAEVHI